MLNLEAEEQTHLLTSRQKPHRKLQNKSFKPMDGRDGTTTFLPLDSRIGGQGRNDRHSIGQFDK